MSEQLPTVQTTKPIAVGGGMELLPVHEQDQVLKEYTDRRTHFREWLVNQLQEGVHFGFPPGCEQKLDKDGNILQFNKRTGNWVPVPRTQWQAKPSLYKAGALFVKDLLQLQDAYESDLDAWKMLGEQKGVYVRRCTLKNRATGVVLGEGTGTFKVGGKGMDENAAIKMADKRALVAAVMNTVALCGDLFTQDTEDLQVHRPRPMENVSKEEASGFGDMLQEWVGEEIAPESPVADYVLTDADVKTLRCQMSAWCGDDVPQTPEAAMTWLKSNAVVKERENEEGEIVGVRFGMRASK